jgi:hypothetical protein
MRLDPNAIRLQVENLKLQHPELLEDDEAWIATLESETDFNEILTTIVRRIEDTKALGDRHKGPLRRIESPQGSV